jgi:hypothetical protein
MAAEGILFVLIGLLFVVLSIALPIWTYSDAQRNSPHSPILWALVVFFGGFLGFILYFIIGRTGGGRGGRGYGQY